MLGYGTGGRWYEFPRELGDFRAGGQGVREYVPIAYGELCAFVDGAVVGSEGDGEGGIGGGRHVFFEPDRASHLRSIRFLEVIEESRVRLLHRLKAAREGREE